MAVLLASCALCLAAGADEIKWDEYRGKHFVVHHVGAGEKAIEIANAAEVHYERIANNLGFKKRDGFWLWDDRVKIFIYPSGKEFRDATGSPQWAAGRAVYSRKEILTYIGSDDFLVSVLPHELAHLIFRDFVGFKGEVPTWLNEGISLWQEKPDSNWHRALASMLLLQNKLIPLEQLTSMTMKDVEEGRRAHDFYAQSATLVEYMLVVHGPENFRKLCGQLRDGKTMEDALRFTYPNTIRSMKELEKAWKQYLISLLNKDPRG